MAETTGHLDALCVCNEQIRQYILSSTNSTECHRNVHRSALARLPWSLLNLTSNLMSLFTLVCRSLLQEDIAMAFTSQMFY